MELDDYFRVGNIVRVHGIKGNVIVHLDVDHPDRYKKVKAVFLEKDGLLLSTKVRSSSLNGTLLNLSLEGCNDRNAAEELIYKEVFLPLSELPAPGDKQVYLHEAVGMTVVDEKAGRLGVIVKVFDYPEQPVAAVDLRPGELLFPLIAEFIRKVDRDSRELHVSLPDGLVDVYR